MVNRYGCLSLIFIAGLISSCSSSDSAKDKESSENPIEQAEVGGEKDPWDGLSESDKLADVLGEDFNSGVSEEGLEIAEDTPATDSGTDASTELPADVAPDVTVAEADAGVSETDSMFEPVTDDVGVDLGDTSYVPLNTDEPSLETAQSNMQDIPVEAPAPKISLKKIKTEPYEVSGILVNAVYIARPSDTLKSISQKIYGTDKTTELKTINTYLTRKVKVGDKIYYNSPNRPTDNVQLLFYPQDANIQMQTYVTNEGDNIRTVSSQLLGYKDAWKEVWSTNPNVESKELVPAGLQLAYYPSLNEGDLAANQEALPPPPAASGADMGMDAPNIPEPGLAAADSNATLDEFGQPVLPTPEEGALPPPSQEGETMAAANEFGDLDNLPPPPPLPSRLQRGQEEAGTEASASPSNPLSGIEGLEFLGDDPVMTLGLGAVGLFGLMMLIAVRRRRKMAEEGFDAVQFETEDRGHRMKG